MGYIYIAMPVLNNLQYVPWLLLFFYRLPWAASEFAETRTPATRTLLCGLCYRPVFFCGGQLLNMVGTAQGFKIFFMFNPNEWPINDCVSNESSEKWLLQSLLEVVGLKFARVFLTAFVHWRASWAFEGQPWTLTPSFAVFEHPPATQRCGMI